MGTKVTDWSTAPAFTRHVSEWFHGWDWKITLHVCMFGLFKGKLVWFVALARSTSVIEWFHGWDG
jgi:hypothetical protein